MQTSVSTTYTIGIPGLLSDASLKRCESAANEEASAEARFGILVAQGAAADGFLLLAANDDVLKGIVVFDHAYHKDQEVGDTGLKPDATGTLLTQGTIWVLTEGTAPTQDDEVHVRAVAAGAEVAGAFRATKDGTDTIDCTPFARWTGRTGTNVAELEINLVNRALATADS